MLRIFHFCLQDSLSEVEEKYKKAMVSNAQLDNDKANLIYQVDTLKDVIEEMEEQMSELRRENEDKSKVLFIVSLLNTYTSFIHIFTFKCQSSGVQN